MPNDNSTLYICNKNGSGLARIGDLFEELPEGWRFVRRVPFRSGLTGAMRTRLDKTNNLVIPTSVLQPYLILVRAGLPDEKRK